MYIAQETIDYQLKDRFGSELEVLLEGIYNYIDKHKNTSNYTIISKHENIAKIEDLIFNRFGFNVIIDKYLHVLSPAAIIPFFGDYLKEANSYSNITKFDNGSFTINRIIKRINEIQKEKNTTLRKIDNKTGYINNKLAKVGGYFSNIRHYLLLDFIYFRNVGITIKELTSIILHELGHVYDGIEEHYRIEQTNKSIFDILSDMRDNKTDKALYRFRTKFNKKELKDSFLDTIEERQDFYGELALSYMNEIGTQIFNRKYNETNYENMADTFSTRFGYGQYIVSGLNKLYSNGGMVINSRALFTFGYTVQIALTVGLLAATPMFGSMLVASFIIFFSGSDNIDYTYDKPIERYNRIKNTIVNALKNSKLDKDIMKEMLDQYDFITEILDSYVNAPSFLDDVSDFLMFYNRNARYYIDTQQLIENSLNNSLFVKYSKIKTL